MDIDDKVRDKAGNLVDIPSLASTFAREIAKKVTQGEAPLSGPLKLVPLGWGLGYGVVIDIVVGGEGWEQALASQVAATIVSYSVVAVFGEGLLFGCAAVAFGYWMNNFIDSLFAETNELEAAEIKDYLNIASTIPSPIVLDLNGDGVTTTALTSGTYFDHAGDGFAEQTAWVSPEDGLLARDLNHNGTIDTGAELFGNNTKLANGQKAANGFLALADLDTNKDGKINASDAAFGDLQVWKDTNGDGITSTGELHSLTELGIVSISTAYTASSTVDANGNSHSQTGTYTTTDGQTRAATDIWFKTDSLHSVATEILEVPDDILNLPEITGYGRMRSLQQAMVRKAA